MVDLKVQEIQELIKNRNWRQLKHELQQLDNIEIAELIDEMPEGTDDIILFRLLSRDQAKEVFQLLSYEKQESIIEELIQNKEVLSNLLNDIDPDDRTALFEELPGKIVQRLLQHLNVKERAIALQLLGYPEDSVGRLMTPEYIAVKSYYTVAEALEHIRKYAKDSETLNVIYVVDKDWKLLDDLKIQDLILARPEQKISELMDYKFVALNAYDDQESAVEVFQDYDRVALPVVNNEGVLLGIVTIDDIMDVAQEETTEDFHKFGSLQSAITNPLKSSILFIYKTRILWLVALVFVNVFSGAVIATFEDVIHSMTKLVFFLTLLIDSGGNAGSQSATIMVRALATGDVRLKDLRVVVLREIATALLLGLTMAMGVALIASFRAPELIIVVSLTMVLTVLVGSLIGLLLPFIFTRIRLDPAAASAPLVTSIADIVGVMIYFSIAKWYFGL